jgi:hypothetical protein
VGLQTQSRHLRPHPRSATTDQFSGLEIAMTKIGDDYTKDHCIKMYNRRLEIEQSEPPVMRVFDIYCHNELCIAMGESKSKQYDIPFWKSRVLMQVFDIGAQDIKLYPEIKDSP